MKGLLELLIYRGGGAVGILLFTILIPIYYDQNDVSNSFLVILYLYLLAMLAKYGIDMLFLKNIPNSDEAEIKENFSSSIVFCFVNSLLIGGGFYFFDLFVLDKQIGKDIILLLPPFACLITYSAFLRAIDKKFYSALTEHGNTFLLASMLLPLLPEYGYDPISTLTIICWSIFLISSFYFIKRQYLEFSNITLVCLAKIKTNGFHFTILALISYAIIC